MAGKGLKLTKPRVGDTYTLGNASFTIIAPNKDYGNDLNNWSVGIRLDYGDNRFVMCGDAEALAEADILKNGIDISADVLKAGHHGSSTSTSEAFLDKVSPSVAVIQCGKNNSYGHPTRKPWKSLKSAEFRYIATTGTAQWWHTATARILSGGPVKVRNRVREWSLRQNQRNREGRTIRILRRRQTAVGPDFRG